VEEIVKLALVLPSMNVLLVFQIMLKELMVHAQLVVQVIPIMSQAYVKIAIHLAIIVLVLHLTSVRIVIILAKLCIKDNAFQAAPKNHLIKKEFV
jgi:hypothetical protein